MNRILFSQEEAQADTVVKLTDFRAEHIRKVLRSKEGDLLQTGVINGPIGISRVERIADEGIWLRPHHTQSAPEPWMDLLLAVPRPKELRRLWAQLAALGVGRIVILSAFRAERNYFSSQWVAPAFYTPLLIEGLMQAGASRLPEVHIRKLFKPFVEDELEGMFPKTMRLLAHPGETMQCRVEVPDASCRPLLAVGPEGGWTDYERLTLIEHGFIPFSLGERTLRTSTATIALIAALMVQFSPQAKKKRENPLTEPV